MRLFVAINLPDRVSDLILAGTEELRSLRGVRWAAPSAIHLTLKFIGEVGGERASEIEAVLRAVAADRGPIDLRLSSVGAFPSLRRPRVVWLGVEEKAELLELQLALEAALEKLDIAPEKRRYRPHVTLGRARKGAEIDTASFSRMVHRAKISGSWTVGEIDLMCSRLRPEGAQYSIVATTRLAGAGTGG